MNYSANTFYSNDVCYYKETMKYKFILVLVVIFKLQFIASCCSFVKYFDYTQLSVELSNTTLTASDSLIIYVLAEDITYLSNHIHTLGLTATTAISCDEGWGGMKHPIENIIITSHQDFDSEHPTGEQLNDLFQIRVFNTDNEIEYKPLSEIEFPFSADNVELLLVDSPTINSEHQFSITFTKSNESILNIATDIITWE